MTVSAGQIFWKVIKYRIKDIWKYKDTVLLVCCTKKNSNDQDKEQSMLVHHTAELQAESLTSFEILKHTRSPICLSDRSV